MKSLNFFLISIFSLALAILFAPETIAKDINLAWDASTSADVTGYKVGVGRSNTLTDATLQPIGNITSTTVTGLSAGSTYYFGVKATNATTESAWSNIISALIPEDVIVPPPPSPVVTCPCSGFTAITPNVTSDPDNLPVELGVRFSSSVAGYITGLRFYKGAGNTGTHTGTLWSSAGVELANVTFTNETAEGWQKADFNVPVAIVPGDEYIASYYAPNGRYAQSEGFFDTAHVSGPLTFTASSAERLNGLYRYGQGFPTDSYRNTNYFVDVVFSNTYTPPVVVEPPSIVVEPPVTPPVVVAPTLFSIYDPIRLNVGFKPIKVPGANQYVWSFPGGNPATVTKKTASLTYTTYPGSGDYSVTVSISGVGIQPVTETINLVLPRVQVDFK